MGNKLVLPQAKKDVPTVQTPDEENASTTAMISGTSYTVMPGDDLWDVAVRAYGDGYQWTKIAEANHLADPNLIHVGNVLKIPRG